MKEYVPSWERWHVAPRDQGQIVEYSYTLRPCAVLMCMVDRSDNTVAYWRSRPLKGDEGDYWNGAPQNARWRKISAAEAEEILAS